jgi:thymidylate synthase ThyX
MITADIIADSISEAGKRITTLSLYYPRFIHAEFMAHRMFSRNASSSRAIPTEKLIQDIIANPVELVYWGKNMKGMQAQEELNKSGKEWAQIQWKVARNEAIIRARRLDDIGTHKQIVNRIIEPYSHIRVCVTATEWDNFFKLRLHPAAQPEMQALAKAMKDAMDASEPRLLTPGQWHLPYVSDEEQVEYGVTISKTLSVARCARVSYRLHDGTPTHMQADEELYKRLLVEQHMSPFEHQATPFHHGITRSNNFYGWEQLRKQIEYAQPDLT